MGPVLAPSIFMNMSPEAIVIPNKIVKKLQALRVQCPLDEPHGSNGQLVREHFATRRDGARCAAAPANQK
jgi:hypothetical protein